VFLFQRRLANVEIPEPVNTGALFIRSAAARKIFLKDFSLYLRSGAISLLNHVRQFMGQELPPY
jgi:hypothetical protein